MRLHLILLFGLCALLLLSDAGLPVARAASPITMQLDSPLALTEKPFALQVHGGRWFPVAVTLKNTGDAVHGTLSLQLTSTAGGGAATSDFYTDVDLPTNSLKRFWLYGRVEREDLDGATVSLRGRGFESLKADMLLKSGDLGTRVVLTISDSDEKLSYLSGFRGAGFGIAEELQNVDMGAPPSQNQSLVRPLGTGHEMVPTRWIGLDGVDLVVLQDFPHTALRPEQLTALRGYVAAGGSLLIFGGTDWQRLAKSPLADLWPIVPTGWSVASAAETSSLVTRYVTASPLTGADRLGGAPIPLTRGTLKPDAQLLAGTPLRFGLVSVKNRPDEQRVVGTSATPLLARMGIGAGQVIFLAADATKPPFLGWSGNRELWLDIFQPTSPPHRIASVDPNASMPGAAAYGGNYPGGPNPYGDQQATNSPLATLLQEMDKAQQLKTPPVSYIAWFLALYVFFLVPVNYCVLRFFDKRELAWVTVPIIVVAFSVISYGAALSIKGRAVLTRHINIVQSTGDSGAARADSVLWLFSPRKTTYDLTSPDPQTVIADYINTEEAARVTIQEPTDAAFKVENAAINMWDRRSFVSHSVINMGQGIHVQVNGTQPVLKNNTPFNLRGVVLLTGGQLRSYGDLKAGATVAKPVGAGDIDLAKPDFVNRILEASQLGKIFPTTPAGSTQDMAQAALPVALGADFAKSGNPGALLIGWSDRPANALTVQNETPQAQNISLFVFRLADDALLNLPAPGKKRSAAASAVEAVIYPAGIESVDANPDSGSGSILTYNCRLPHLSSALNGATAWKGLDVMARGRTTDYNSNRYGYNSNRYNYNNRRWDARRKRWVTIPAASPKQTPKNYSVQFEVWNFAKARWQPLAAQGGANWKVQSHIATVKELIRQPDNLIRLRARTAHSGVAVDAVRVRAER